MRILLLTRDDPYETLTGVAVYVRDLATALVREGHTVAHLYLDSRPRRAGPSLRRLARNGVPATVVAAGRPSTRSLADCLTADVTSVSLTRMLGEAVEEMQPDLLHVHDLSGIPAAVVPAVETRGYPVAVTLHDFWPFCRQLLLVRPGLVPCAGSGGGRNCALYCSDRAAHARGLLKRTAAMLPDSLRPYPGRLVRLYRKAQGRPHSQFVVPASSPVTGVPAEPDVRPHALREQLMRQALLAAGCLMAPSVFAKERYVRHGYPAERIRVLPLSLLAFGRIERRVRSFARYPVRFGYLGRVTPWKGAHVLAAAMRGVPAGSARTTLYGAVDAADREYLRGLSGAHPDVRFAGSYTREELPRILDEIDVAIFPSIMSETLGLVGVEAQAAGIPIIASDLAAIPEYVRHDVNGLLFPAGDAAALRQRMLQILEQPRLIARLSARTHAPSSMEDHVGAITRIYAELTARPRDRRADVVAAPTFGATPRRVVELAPSGGEARGQGHGQ